MGYKVDEVANMEVVGLYIDGTKTEGQWDKGAKLHVFSRTRNAPYFFYYRYLALDEMNWYPWEKMQVDIPSYDVEGQGDDEGKTIGNGTYLIPAVWNDRLLVFFPQFLKKTRPKKVDENFEAMGTNKVQDRKPEKFWEIKMAWSEYQNGKWTQKQVSKDSIYHGITMDEWGTDPATGVNYYRTYYKLSLISGYSFAPMIRDLNVIINVFYNSYVNIPGSVLSALENAFEFNGSSMKIGTRTLDYNDALPDNFHYNITIIHSLQADSAGFNYLTTTPDFEDQSTEVIFRHDDGDRDFYHPFTHDLLGKVALLRDLKQFFEYNLTQMTRIKHTRPLVKMIAAHTTN